MKQPNQSPLAAQYLTSLDRVMTPTFPHRARWVDWLGVLMLSVGSVLLPVFGWLIGISLVQSSPRFNRRQKITALTVWPFGLLGPAALVFLPPGLSLVEPWGVVVAVLLFAAPLVVLGWLIRTWAGKDQPMAYPARTPSPPAASELSTSTGNPGLQKHDD